MEVKIGVQHAPREIVLESGQSAEEVESAVAEALSGKAQLLSLVDEHGRKVLVPADRLAYVEIGEPAPAQGGLRRAVGPAHGATQDSGQGPVVSATGPFPYLCPCLSATLRPSQERSQRTHTGRIAFRGPRVRPATRPIRTTANAGGTSRCSWKRSAPPCSASPSPGRRPLRLPHRLPSRALVLPTGIGGGALRRVSDPHRARPRPCPGHPRRRGRRGPWRSCRCCCAPRQPADQRRRSRRPACRAAGSGTHI